ncbi:MAG: sigma 54-interacting transcriptional regulator [Sphingomonadales bacterium]|nr:sigma-54-dependent Fis family transcriptional regulator [Sphingomonadales bacterium]
MELIQVKQRFGIVGNSSMLNNALETAIKVAPTDMNVLILGDSGVGKESFSKIIHQLSGRKHAPFIAVNCGAIPEGTIDSELFGHEKGAFTGATDKRKGYFETVNGGTIFLDEVGELPLGTQARLLRILENGEFIKVGSSAVQKTDVRVVCATNRDLLERSRQGKFREDLYYRLATVPLRVPKLAERREDIVLLFRKFASDFAETHRSGHIELTPEAQQLISQYSWPGNVRQLKNVTEQICVLEDAGTLPAETVAKYLPPAEPSLPVLLGKSEGYGEGMSERDIFYKVLIDLKRDVTDLKKLVFGMLENPGTAQPVVMQSQSIQNPTPIQLPAAIDQQPIKPIASAVNGEIILQPHDKNPLEIEHEYVEAVSFPAINENLSLEEKELEMIRIALAKSKGRRKKAAEALGISERTLYRKIKQYELE